MPAHAPTPAPDAPLDPTALARFGRLESLARLVVEGVMACRADRRHGRVTRSSTRVFSGARSRRKWRWVRLGR